MKNCKNEAALTVLTGKWTLLNWPLWLQDGFNSTCFGFTFCFSGSGTSGNKIKGIKQTNCFIHAIRFLHRKSFLLSSPANLTQVLAATAQFTFQFVLLKERNKEKLNGGAGYKEDKAQSQELKQLRLRGNTTREFISVPTVFFFPYEMFDFIFLSVCVC